MNKRITYIDLQSKWMGIEVANFARRFMPQDWRRWVTPMGLQHWAMLLLRAGYGAISPGLGVRLGVKGPDVCGVGTFYRTETGVHYIWGAAGEFRRYTLPEWGLGVWRDVTSAFLTHTSPFPNIDDDSVASDVDALSEELLAQSRGRRVFEVLGILGGIWNPANSVGPEEESLDISKS